MDAQLRCGAQLECSDAQLERGADRQAEGNSNESATGVGHVNDAQSSTSGEATRYGRVKLSLHVVLSTSCYQLSAYGSSLRGLPSECVQNMLMS